MKIKEVLIDLSSTKTFSAVAEMLKELMMLPYPLVGWEGDTPAP